MIVSGEKIEAVEAAGLMIMMMLGFQDDRPVTRRRGNSDRYLYVIIRRGREKLSP